MPSLFSIITGYFFAGLALLFFAYFIGHFLLRWFPQNFYTEKYSPVFFKLLSGATAGIIFISLACTKGKSISLLFVLPVLFHFIEKRFNTTLQKTNPPTKLKDAPFVLPGVFIIFVLAFLWQASVILKMHGVPVESIEKDSLFYAEISKSLINTGFENTFANYNLASSNYLYPTPYHYFDLWLNGIMAKTFGLNYSLCLYLVTYTFFTALFMLGILALAEKFTTIKWYHFAIAFLLMFVSGLYVSENGFDLYNYSAQMEGMNERFGNKLSAACCFALAFILLFTNHHFKSAFSVLLCLPFISISLAPAVYGGILVFCIVSILRKSEHKRFYLRLIIYVIVCLVFIELFYSLQKKNNLNYRLTHSLFEYTDFKQVDYHHLKYFTIELFLKLWAQPALFFLNYLPFIFVPVVLYFKSGENKFRLLTAVFVCIWLCGLVTFGSFYLMDDAHQFYTNSLILFHVFFAYSLLELIKLIDARKSILAFGLAGLFFSALAVNCFHSWYSFKGPDYFVMHFSEKYIAEVNRECSSFTSETKGAVFCDTVFYRNLLISYPLEYHALPFIYNPHVQVPFNLTAKAEIFQGNIYQLNKVLSLNPFNQYLDATRNDGIPPQQLLLKFISENKIRYLLCPKNMNPEIPKELNIKTILSDELSGQRFVILNPSN